MAIVNPLAISRLLGLKRPTTACRALNAMAVAGLVVSLSCERTQAAEPPGNVRALETEQGTVRLEADGATIAEATGNMEAFQHVWLPGLKVEFVAWTVAAETDAGEARRFYTLRRADGTWATPKQASDKIRLSARTFDPLDDSGARESGNVPESILALDGAEQPGLHLVQFHTQVVDAYRDAIRQRGGEVLSYIPDNTLIVRGDESVASRIGELSFVRWVGRYAASDRLATEVARALHTDDAGRRRYVISLFVKSDRPRALEYTASLNAPVTETGEGSRFISAELTPAELTKLLRQDFVEFVELATKPEVDVDHARCQGGADDIEMAPPGYSGIGIRGHVLEGIEPTHPDFKANAHRMTPIAVSDPAPDSHGQCTFGEIFSDGTGDPNVKGVIYNAQGLYTNNNYVYEAEEGTTAAGSRHELVGRLIRDYGVMFQTASWGYQQNTVYDGRSKEMDDIIFDHDIPITQSQSNTGSQLSRRQAWAKNIISVGAAYHYNNCDATEDRWNGGASTGPAPDGRIKPDLCAYYDLIDTTDGDSGYTEEFGGTSGATPIVAGHVGLVLEMWTNGIFGNALPHPATPENRFLNKPHASTVKALLICSATQYEHPPATDLSRTRQGWGFPSVKTLHDHRDRIRVVNEDDVLVNLDVKSYDVTVEASQPLLKVCLVYNEPGASVAAAIQRLNDLTLKVTAPDGTTYWGNQGLATAKASSSGGAADTLNTVECVFLENPAAGAWKVEVHADDINTDSHVETPETDADYALVILGSPRE